MRKLKINSLLAAYVNALRLIAVALLLGVTTTSSAQGTVKGFLKSESSGEAVMFASVTLEGTSFGVSSDVEGYFSLSRIPAGQYTLVVTSLEFETVKKSIEIRNNKVLTSNMLLSVQVVELGGADTMCSSMMFAGADLKHIHSPNVRCPRCGRNIN